MIWNKQPALSSKPIWHIKTKELYESEKKEFDNFVFISRIVDLWSMYTGK